MATIRINPLGSLTQLRNEMDRWFSDLAHNLPLSGWPAALGERPFPAVNVWDSGSDLHVEAELPGIGLDDLEIFVVGNELTLRGERRASDPSGSAYHRRERGVGKFSRVLRLPVDVTADRVSASLTDGVLHIVLPKAEEAKPRKIAVSVQ